MYELSFFSENKHKKFDNILFKKVLDCLEDDNRCLYTELVDCLCYVIVRDPEIQAYGVQNISIINSIRREIRDRNWHLLDTNIYRMYLEEYVFIYKKIKLEEDVITLLGFILERTPELDTELVRKQTKYVQRCIVDATAGESYC